MSTPAQIGPEAPEAIEAALAADSTLIHLQQIDFPDLKNKYILWQDKSTRANGALMAITKIETDEQDAAAEKLLVKVRNTYELINSERMPTTKTIDGVKALLMEPENLIDPNPKKTTTQYARVKGMRDEYNRAKLLAAQKIQQDALKEQRRRDELTRIKTVLELRFIENVLNSVQSLEQSLALWLSSITLETYDAQASRLSVKPNLKKETFDGWFAVQYDTSAVPVDGFNDFMRQVREQYTYDVVNANYQVQAAATVETYRGKLPGLKVELERIAALNAEEAKAAQEKLAKEQEQQANARQQELANNAQAQVATVTQDAAMDKLNNAFDATLAIQTADTNIKGARKVKRAVLTCAPEQIVQTLAKLLFTCYMSPEFAGHVHRNPDGTETLDKDGIPEYMDWLKPLMVFYATKCANAGVEGIEIRETLSTVQRAR